MKVTVVANLDNAYAMLKKRGLEPDGKIQKLFTVQCAKEMGPYVPMQQGILKNTRIIGAHSVTYNVPYARVMYYGKVMVDSKTGKGPANIPNVGYRFRKGAKLMATEREFSYHGAPKRGKLWDKRMWADKKMKIIDNVAKAAGGKAQP